MSAIGQLNEQQFKQVLLLGGAARYAEMYRYIATEIEANRLTISSASGGKSTKT